MLDLNTGVDFDEVVSAELVDEELAGSGVAVVDMAGDLDGVGEHGLADVLREVHGRGDFDDLLVTTLDRAITLEEVDDVPLAVSEDLDFDVPWAFKETLNEDGSIAESGLGLGNGTAEGIGKFSLLTDDTHTTSSASHGSLDDHWRIRISGSVCCGVART